MSFAIGQRWISESENNLGLGIITEQDNRTVTIFFPASDETRIYALASAPLTRVLFQQGDEITHQLGWKAKVVDVMMRNELAFYLVQRLDNNEDAVVQEMELAHQISFSKPQDRLFSAQIDRNEHFVLRYNALKHQQAQFQSSLRGLRGNRAGLIPHQLHIAQEVGSRIAPRVLLADEVGLGKTIEAGMILQQQLFAEKVQRVLILVPETLQHQWLVEMLRRFNLHFSLFDEERCADFDSSEERSATNPFASENLIICALDWLVQQPKRAQQALAGDFDLLIVDEAHHLAWSEDAPSIAYEFVERLSAVIPAVLLLTATPEQLGQQSHFARLRLLDPNRFYDYQAFEQEQQQYKPVADAVQSLLSEHILTAEEQNHLAELLSEQDIEPMLKVLNSQADAEQKALARDELISNLIDRHGTSRLLFRNTRQGVKGFPHRTYHQIKLDLPTQYQNAIKVLGLLGEIKEQDLFYPEQIFQKMNADATWWYFDPRVDWLINLVKSLRDEKILVICQQATTAIQLEQALREKEGIRSAVFHENMSIVERDRASAYFAQQEEGAQVLLSSSIGSEGRNFQFACHLVLFNLPNNPDLLEQCIGRLDRIGQRRDIQIYAPCFTNTPQIRLAQWYHEGLNAFEETCPMGATLFEKCGAKLTEFLTTDTTDDFDVFIKQTHQQQLQLKAQLEQGRDRLLELNSNGGEQAQELANEIAAQDGSTELIDFTLNLFDIIGVEQEDLGEKSIVISPTGTMLVPDFPGLKEEGVTVTFDRELALAREELEFLTWDHPIVRNGIDLIVSGDIGKSAVALLVNKQLPAGTLLLELIYMVESQSPRGLQLTRFLPPTPLRLLLDIKGNDLSNQVSFKGLQKQLKPMGKNMATKVIKMLRPAIEQLLKQSEQNVIEPAKVVIEKAKQLADQSLSAEINRLSALQAVNKNIRPEEIEQLEQQRALSLELLSQATWRLDSLRVIVSNKE
ncbi:ATP-dependent helicase HepA [Canicola haemoglobinophilus]|uniref:RNA polymerase-associated protein RapA n=1 Tax=Canicola haemoglobinophilus TaxID=733 RepID=A0AB38HB88_9PAST|nr:RNA polymerase-associated protein RapA [Canicola haemoglobinophilus]STO54852.1 ATP-dependent helicase HepA [Canicola haemoglobinophilus]STO69577.1 ATP-dependent helicase HepA [Canicola haemoglobinophilus]